MPQTSDARSVDDLIIMTNLPITRTDPVAPRLSSMMFLSLRPVLQRFDEVDQVLDAHLGQPFGRLEAANNRAPHRHVGRPMRPDVAAAFPERNRRSDAIAWEDAAI